MVLTTMIYCSGDYNDDDDNCNDAAMMIYD